MLEQVPFTEPDFNRTLVISWLLPYSYLKDMEGKKMTIIWGGTLAVLLSRFRKNLYRVTKLNHNVDAQIKRIGVYYMCIDDLPI